LVISPFRFEGRKRNDIALKSFQLLKKKGYNLIIIFGHEVLEKNRVTGLTVQEAFDILDRKMIEAIRLISR
jgi:cell division GTPase FtsZ